MERLQNRQRKWETLVGSFLLGNSCWQYGHAGLNTGSGSEAHPSLSSHTEFFVLFAAASCGAFGSLPIRIENPIGSRGSVPPLVGCLMRTTRKRTRRTNTIATTAANMRQCTSELQAGREQERGQDYSARGQVVTFDIRSMARPQRRTWAAIRFSRSRPSAERPLAFAIAERASSGAIMRGSCPYATTTGYTSLSGKSTIRRGAGSPRVAFQAPRGGRQIVGRTCLTEYIGYHNI